MKHKKIYNDIDYLADISSELKVQMFDNLWFYLRTPMIANREFSNELYDILFIL